VTRIVGGVVTEENEYPWQVGLEYPGYSPFCGGSIISEKSVLTAAHCTAGKNAGEFIVRVGSHDSLSASSGREVTVCAINDHADYDSDSINYDYSVLTLCESLTFSRDVSPVCLPESGDGAMFEGKDNVVTGWGTTSSGGDTSQYLQEVTMTTMTNNECCSGNYQYGCSQITDVMMCAANSGKDSCQGDSGGPLVYYQNNVNYVQTGVVSWGTGCADAAYPGVYARVSSVMEWIMSLDETINVCPGSTQVTIPTINPVTTMPPAPATTQAPSNCNCGIPNRVTKIVNGAVTEENEYPWQVGLANSGYAPFCGGSIIGEKEILTAAHCTAGKSAGDFNVLVGGHNVWSASSGVQVTVCAINDHPSYNPTTVNYDYSVLTLCSPLTLTKGSPVFPVCLPEAGDGAIFEGKESVVTGWGTTSSGGQTSQYLQEVTLTTMTNTQCCTGNYQYGCSQITDVMMCAASPSKDSCQGDSGGPLVYYQNNVNYVQTGVVSFGTGCADAAYPGVYARVTSVMAWIQSVSTTSNYVCPA